MKLSKENKGRITHIKKVGCAKPNGIIRWLGEYGFGAGTAWKGLDMRQANHEDMLEARIPEKEETTFAMKYTLYKCSKPGWTKHFSSEYELKETLYKHICSSCLKELEFERIYGEREYCSIIGEKPDPRFEDIDLITVDHCSVWDLLGTACGFEYEMEEND